jgi:hypothetical protein
MNKGILLYEWSFVWICLCAVMFLPMPSKAQGAGNTSLMTNAHRAWKPVPDKVYLQEVGAQIPSAKPLTAIAVYRANVYVVEGGTLKKLKEYSLEQLNGAPAGIQRIKSLPDALWAVSENGTYRFSNESWERVDEKPFQDFCVHLGQVYGATRDDIYRLESGRFVNIRPAEGYLTSDTTVLTEEFKQVLTDPVHIGSIEKIASYSGTLYLLRPGSLALMEGRTLVTDPVDWGMLPSPVTRDLLSQGSRLYLATDRGVAVLRGMALTSLRGADGLPYEDVTCLSEGFDNDLWIGTSRGAVRKVGEEYHYFGASNWLPHENVHGIAVDNQTAYIATEGGLGIIRYEPFTLAKKAQFFERQLSELGFQRLGFIHKLYWGDDQEGWLREISDNDGGNTAYYLAAMTFKYGATRDEEARKEALEAFKAMTWLGEITDVPGFIARAIWSVRGDKGQRSTTGSGGLPAKWYPTPDGVWLWKGDTSSDEVNAHMFAISLFHDLAAKGAERDRAKDHLTGIASHIMTNGWVLRDKDGKPTRWGRWDPEYLQRPYGFESRGLNGLEAQTYMHVAFALTGNSKFQAGLQQLLQWRYQTYTVRQKITFPPDQVATWDDELAFFCFHALLRYATDPDLRSLYLRSLERSWEVQRIQQIPFFNFIYGALTGNDCEAAQAVQHLREWSLDLINHSYRNSHRADLATQRGYVPYCGGTRAISPRETEAKWGSRPAMQYDGGEDNKGMTPPIGWLMDYWMGRYYGFIEPAQSDLSNTVVLQRSRPKGAAPYDGPPRPLARWEHSDNSTQRP